MSRMVPPDTQILSSPRNNVPIDIQILGNVPHRPLPLIHQPNSLILEFPVKIPLILTPLQHTPPIPFSLYLKFFGVSTKSGEPMARQLQFCVIITTPKMQRLPLILRLELDAKRSQNPIDRINSLATIQGQTFFRSQKPFNLTFCLLEFIMRMRGFLKLPGVYE